MFKNLSDTFFSKKYLLVAAILPFTWAMGGCQSKKNDTMDNQTTQNNSLVVPTAPVAKIEAYYHKEHGTERLDNYFWLRDDKRENPEVLAYLEAENDYLKKSLAHTEAFQEKLFAEMKGRIKEQDESVPYKKGNFWYYTRYDQGKEYAIYARKKGTLTTEESILLDGNARGAGKSYYSVGAFSISPNENILAFSEDTVGRRNYVLQFKDLNTGEILADVIPDVESVAWANDSKTLFYVKKHPETLRSFQVWKHVLGTKVSQDVLMHEEKDESYYTSVYKTKSDRYILISLNSTLNSEIRILDADKPQGKFEVFHKREPKHEYSIDHRGDKFYIRTNWEAENFRLMEVAVGKQQDKKNWKEVLPHRSDVFLEDFDLFKDFMVVSERKEGLIQLRIFNHKDNSEHYVPFKDPVYSVYTTSNPEMNTETLRYAYTSLTMPNSTYDYHMESKTTELKKMQEVVGGYNPDEYVSKRLWATAADGTKVPISLVHKKELPQDGKSPLYINAYGSYGVSSDVYFSTTRLSLLQRGFTFAIAHVRGGGELGRKWYEDGKLLKKKNTFTDFIDCTKFLQQQGYGSAENTFAMGGSAGGLLMGAIVNMNPELYKGVVSHVPFVDVISTMMDASIPLTTNEYDEWGNPNNKEYYDYMLSYSPYDNIKAQNYPNLLVTTGLHDSQVQYWEPAKWVAKLRATKTDNNRLYLYTNMTAGHGGASGRFSRLKEYALEYAFIFDLLGIRE
jgi:oligopeptidase B